MTIQNERKKMKKIIIIYSNDYRYMNQFIEYFEQYVNGAIEIRGFSDPKKFISHIKDVKYERVIIDEAEYSKFAKEMTAERTMILTSDEKLESIDQMKAIYKYQKIKNIIDVILDHMANDSGFQNIFTLQQKKSDVDIVGIYSPIKRCGKTQIGLEYANYQGKNKKTLFITMDEYGYIPDYAGEGYNLEDLLYFYFQNTSAFNLKLKVIAQPYRSFDIIPPISSGDAIREVKIEEWKGFFRKVIDSSDYELIVIDISDIALHIPEILKLCTFCIIPYTTDEMSEMKLRKYKERMELFEKEEKFEVYEMCMDNVITYQYKPDLLQQKVKKIGR